MNYKKILKGILCYMLIVLSSLLLSFVIYLKTYFNTTTFEQLLYNLLNIQTLNIRSISQSISSVIFYGILILTAFSVPFLIPCFTAKKWIVEFKNKKIQLFPIHLRKFSGVVFIFSLIVTIIACGIGPFLKNQLSYSTLYNDYYVPYKEENLVFPEEKQNLIMIYVESFESSIFSEKNGGTQKTSYAPNLEKMVLNSRDTIHFSNTNKLGGFHQVNGANWTIASLISQTAGIPIYIQTKNENNHFLEGAVTIGDILEEHGYQNVFMLGSNADFAERRLYFKEHGNYYIYDYEEARYRRDIPSNYFVWWGYEDNKLYENAKGQLKELAKRNKPFNFTLLTADTHYFDGYLDESCPNKFDDSYANSYYCMDIMLSNFLEWIRNQDFYRNTTIIVVGDHLTMRDDFFKIDKNYDRTVFNLFFNSRVTTENIKNRDFSALDMFPTTLAALGVTIDNDRLALGTNLFSDKKTLMEELGYEKFTNELGKSSNYYDRKLLKIKD